MPESANSSRRRSYAKRTDPKQLLVEQKTLTDSYKEGYVERPRLFSPQASYQSADVASRIAPSDVGNNVTAASLSHTFEANKSKIELEGNLADEGDFNGSNSNPFSTSLQAAVKSPSTPKLITSNIIAASPPRHPEPDKPITKSNAPAVAISVIAFCISFYIQLYLGMRIVNPAVNASPYEVFFLPAIEATSAYLNYHNTNVDLNKWSIGILIAGIASYIADYHVYETNEDIYRLGKLMTWLAIQLKNAVNRLIALRQKIPLTLQYFIAIFFLTYVVRLALEHMASLACSLGAYLWPFIWKLGIISAGGYVFLNHYRMRNISKLTQSEVVSGLSVLVKSLLSQRSAPYPIVYLYEELLDCIQHGSLLSPTKALSSKVPAIPVSATAPLPAQAAGGANANVADNIILSTNGLPTEEKIEAASVGDVLKIDLKGLKLPQLWPDVKLTVGRDKRIKTLDVVVDGKQQACWVMMKGSTSAAIASHFQSPSQAKS